VLSAHGDPEAELQCDPEWGVVDSISHRVVLYPTSAGPGEAYCSIISPLLRYCYADQEL